jgi:hypothetical protein
LASWGAVGCAIFSTLQARAFSYPEHFVITRHAIASVVRTDPNARALVAEAGAYFTGTSMSGAPPDSPALEVGKFDLADLPALAGDHATTPHHLMRRWFWGPPSPRSCRWRNLGDALADLDAYSEPSSVCAERPDNEPCDRDALLSAVRQYHDGSSTLQSTEDMDGALATADCAYVCLAERNVLHFRLPGVPVETAATLADVPNAAHSYAKWHALALALAAVSHHHPEARVRYRAAALIYELFALHFLQDGVAAGHIVTPRGYGNMTALATHDHHNRTGIAVVVPEAACEHPFTARLPKLARRCRPGTSRRATVRGDHAIASGLSREPEDVSEELAELSAEVSLQEVLRENVAPTFPVRDFKDELEATLAAFELRTSSKCEADWTCSGRESHLLALIRLALARPGGMEALAMWPAVSAPTRPPIERPGGHNVYVRLATALAPNVRGSVGAGYAFMASKQSMRLVLAADAVLSYGQNIAGGGIHGAAMVHWAEVGGFSFLNEAGLTLDVSPRGARFDLYACPLSYELTADRMSLHAGLLAGLSPVASPDGARWFLGLGMAATLHASRNPPPALEQRPADRGAP